MSEAAVDAHTEAVTVRFGPLVALDEVTVRIRPGMCTVIIGDRGSGKTTLARVLAGLLPPSAGRSWLGGTETTTLSTADRRTLAATRVAALVPGRTVGGPRRAAPPTPASLQGRLVVVDDTTHPTVPPPVRSACLKRIAELRAAGVTVLAATDDQAVYELADDVIRMIDGRPVR